MIAATDRTTPYSPVPFSSPRPPGNILVDSRPARSAVSRLLLVGLEGMVHIREVQRLLPSTLHLRSHFRSKCQRGSRRSRTTRPAQKEERKPVLRGRQRRVSPEVQSIVEEVLLPRSCHLLKTPCCVAQGTGCGIRRQTIQNQPCGLSVCIVLL